MWTLSLEDSVKDVVKLEILALSASQVPNLLAYQRLHDSVPF